MNNFEQNQPNENNRSDVPDDVSEIIKSLKEREETRRRAIDLAFEQVAKAETSQDQRASLKNLGNMLHVM